MPITLPTVVIAAARRTAIGSLNGTLATVMAHELGAAAIAAAVRDAAVPPEDVDETILGQVLSAGHGMNPARQAARLAGLPDAAPAALINQVCGSGLRAVALAAQQIQTGSARIVVAGGQESMTNAPHTIAVRRAGKLGDLTMRDSVMSDGLSDAVYGYPMGNTAETIAERYAISREAQDEFALASQIKASAAAAVGRFADEIVPIAVETRKGPISVSDDEHIRHDSTAEGLARLRPAFAKTGTVTAGNSSGINDGAAALVLMAEDEASARGATPLARIAAWAHTGLDPQVMGLGPISASRTALERAPDFGPAGATDRLGQVDPAVLVAVASYGYAGKHIDTTASINAVASATRVRRIVLLGDVPAPEAHQWAHTTFEDWIAPYSAGPIDYHRGAFDAPLAILYSSGTTGRPKCIMHSAGGLLLQHLKEHQLHCDLRPDDRLFYYTTCGWMMWNWLVSGLATGATLVTYDGNPSYPQPARLADLIDAERITIFGTSAKHIDACNKADVAPAESHSLASLRTILSTGSPLLPASFDYIYRQWKADLHLASISGGTDICGCFLGGVPTLPVRRGELQGAMLGLDVVALGPDGQPVAGEPGELVCRNAHPSMPVAFWGDPDGSRYHAAYFERFPGIWTHGDYVERRPSGGFVVHGRSDTTLNPGGVRIGTAEIYRIVEAIAEVEEAVAVGQDWQGDQRIVLFLKLRPGYELGPALEARVRSQIRSAATPRHVPARIVAVPAIPRTRSGKISEVAVRDTIHGCPIGNDTALANPECLAAFANLPQLAE